MYKKISFLRLFTNDADSFAIHAVHRDVLVQTWAAQFHFSNLRLMQKPDKKAKGDVIQQVSIAQSQRDVCIHACQVDYNSKISTSL